MMRRSSLALLLVACANLAHGQLRTIPQDAQRARTSQVHDNAIQLDGSQYTLAPGAQIRDEANRIILPTTLKEGALVKYRRDAAGYVREIWVLSDEEARKQE
jgi:hypothetical protein